MKEKKDNLNWLVGGGEMADLIRSIDWSKTPLGPIETWPQSLRTTVSLCLASNFPINIIWGPEAIQIYNDGYRVVCGGVHPRAMGEPYSVTWASAWPVIGEPFEQARRGKTSYLENQRMFLSRNGYLEETFFTFSLSPIRAKGGGTAGLFHPVTETTATMLSSRRTRVLRDIADKTRGAQTVLEAAKLAIEALSDYHFDLPFALFYLFDSNRKIQLVGRTGLSKESFISQEKGFENGSIWPFSGAQKSTHVELVHDVTNRCGKIFCGDYPEPIEKAYLLPIKASGLERPLGFVVAGLSTRLPLDEFYQGFFELLASALNATINDARSYQEEKKRAEALAEIDRAKTAFFHNVSHEFRTPLTLMLGPIEDILAGKKGELTLELRSEAEVIHRNTLRLLKLVNTLLDFSRLEANRVQANYEPTDLATLTTDLVSSFRSAVEKAGMNLIVDARPLPVPVFVDRDMWEKIVLNLLSNAFKYTLQGEIRVTLIQVQNSVELSVTDTGIGIPELELPKIFQRFHRVQGVQGRTHEGTGIGLALVQELVKLHKGTIQLKSEFGKGSTFTVSIPLGDAHLSQESISKIDEARSTATRAEAFVKEALRWIPSDPAAIPDAPPEPNPPTPSSSTTGIKSRRKRILLADDNADMRDYIRKILSSRYDVIPVENGKQGLDASLSQSPDLIISDIMMPVMNGLEFLEAIRAHPTMKTLPVIFLSARAGEEEKVSGIGIGADDYLTKPFSAAELQARVQTQLNLAEMRSKLLLDLELANKELEAFSYSVSHDLRAPLRSIDGFSQFLLEEYADKLDDQGREYIQRVRASVKSMGKLIEDLLGLSHLNSQELVRTKMNLSKLVHELGERLKKENPTRTIEFLVEKDVFADGDEGLLRVVLENLLGNAVKYTSKHPSAKIEFGANLLNEKQVYFVKDDGAGFDQRFKDKLFGTFQRLHSSKEFPGTGIGLATTMRVIHRHQGKIWAEGAIEKGATFYFYL